MPIVPFNRSANPHPPIPIRPGGMSNDPWLLMALAQMNQDDSAKDQPNGPKPEPK